MKHLLGVAAVVTLLSGSVAFAQYDHNQGTNPGQTQGGAPANNQDHHDNGNNPGQDQGRVRGDNQDHHNNDNTGYGGRHHHRRQVCNWYHHYRHCHWTWG